MITSCYAVVYTILEDTNVITRIMVHGLNTGEGEEMLNPLCKANSTGGDLPLLASHPPTLLVLTVIGREIRGQRKTLKEGGLSPLHFSNVDTFQYALDNEKMQLEGFRNTVSQKFQIFQGEHVPRSP